MTDKLIIMGILLIGIIMGFAVAYPYKIYTITIIERVGSAVPHREYVFLSKKKAIKMYQELRIKAVTAYAKEAPNDWRFPEDYDINGTELQKNQKLSVTDDIENLLARCVIRCPFNDYDKEVEMELRLKYIS